MKTNKYIALWILITLILAGEYIFLKFKMDYGFIPILIEKYPDIFAKINYDLQVGRDLSHFLGWVGSFFILLTSLYVIRKKIGWTKNSNSVARSLNFHIFYGLIGPTLIAFHTSFKIGGLAAISFWSMVVVVISGFIGKYFFDELWQYETEIKQKKNIGVKLTQFYLKKHPTAKEEDIFELKKEVVGYLGIKKDHGTKSLFLITVLYLTIMGDLRIILHSFGFPTSIPSGTQKIYIQYALYKRRSFFADYYQRIMGYWYSIHVPFSILMIIFLLIHIVVVLFFRVD